MENSDLAALISRQVFLGELAGENPFKLRAFQNAIRVVDYLPESASTMLASGALAKTPGIGKGLLAFISEALEKGEPAEYRELAAKYPETIFELLEVRGLGPKKAKALYNELQIASLAELEYACRENRLVELKGFGQKTQDNTLAAIAEIKARRGKLLLPQAQNDADNILQNLNKEISSLKGKAPFTEKLQLAGELARSSEIVSALEFFSADPAALKALPEYSERGLKIIGRAPALGESEALAYIRAVASEKFWQALEKKIALNSSDKMKAQSKSNSKNIAQLASPAEIFAALNLPNLSEECWEDPALLDLPQNFSLVEAKDIRGTFHLHTNASDGLHSLEDMAEACMALGYEYMGVSEHSQSAVYAHGLGIERVLAQRAEVEKLNKKYAAKGFTIFHGIESDILPDGALDYPDEILEKFDFVIASLHGQLRQSTEDMTARLCRALENPHTTWLGHPTARLLLGRKPVSLDMEKFLATAARSGTALELNANPYRLDLDWRHLQAAKKLDIKIGIHSDAHSKEGLGDISYGLLMARKGGLEAADVTNTFSTAEIQKWLKQKKSKKQK